MARRSSSRGRRWPRRAGLRALHQGAQGVHHAAKQALDSRGIRLAPGLQGGSPMSTPTKPREDETVEETENALKKEGVIERAEAEAAAVASGVMVGALTGAIAGPPGAVVGGVVGGVVGAVVGATLDREKRRHEAQEHQKEKDLEAVKKESEEEWFKRGESGDG